MKTGEGADYMDRLLAAITCDFDGESVLFFRRQSGSPKPFMNELSIESGSPAKAFRPDFAT